MVVFFQRILFRGNLGLVEKNEWPGPGYLLGPGRSMVAQFPDAQLRSLTCGMDGPPFPELPTLIFDITRLISGD
jgi:hypothetical protein